MLDIRCISTAVEASIVVSMERGSERGWGVYRSVDGVWIGAISQCGSECVSQRGPRWVGPNDQGLRAVDEQDRTFKA